MGEIIDLSVKNSLRGGGRQSKELWTSRGSCLANEILRVVELVGMTVTTQLMTSVFTGSASVLGLWLPHLVAAWRPSRNGCFDHSLLQRHKWMDY